MENVVPFTCTTFYTNVIKTAFRQQITKGDSKSYYNSRNVEEMSYALKMVKTILFNITLVPLEIYQREEKDL